MNEGQKKIISRVKVISVFREVQNLGATAKMARLYFRASSRHLPPPPLASYIQITFRHISNFDFFSGNVNVEFCDKNHAQNFVILQIR